MYFDSLAATPATRYTCNTVRWPSSWRISKNLIHMDERDIVTFLLKKKGYIWCWIQCRVTKPATSTFPSDCIFFCSASFSHKIFAEFVTVWSVLFRVYHFVKHEPVYQTVVDHACCLIGWQYKKLRLHPAGPCLEQHDVLVILCKSFIQASTWPRSEKVIITQKLNFCTHICVRSTQEQGDPLWWMESRVSMVLLLNL